MARAPSLTTIKTQLDDMHAEVKDLAEAVYKGNGHSIMTRLALVEENIEQTVNKKTTNKLFLAALIPALIGFVTGLLALI